MMNYLIRFIQILRSQLTDSKLTSVLKIHLMIEKGSVNILII